jgi:tetratricopeptide (TPR) repeat protein
LYILSEQFGDYKVFIVKAFPSDYHVTFDMRLYSSSLILPITWTQDVYKIREPTGVGERALEVFSRIEGLDDIKEMMLRAESPERAHTLGNPAEAIQYFDKALDLDPKNEYALANKGVSLIHSGNPAEAIQYFDKALAIDPNDGIAARGKQHALDIMDRQVNSSPQ